MKIFFCTKCNYEDKGCDVIINSETTKNLVLEETVKNFKIKREKYPHLYQISQLQDELKVMVSKQCLVKFKIGSYHDEVLCDIMHMDVCHLL